MTVEIVILAMVAAFLGLRLYAVLGRRADHSEEPLQSRFESPSASAAPARPALVPVADTHIGAAPALREPVSVSAPIERGLRDIASADRKFEPTAFLDGARSAYRMILEAFWRGDKEQLAQLCDAHVAQSFTAAIDARLAAGEVLDNRLVRIDEAVITAASYAAPVARVAVRLVADIAAVTRDASGTVIAGSLDDAVPVREVWTFTRNIGSPDPDWHLDETDEA